MKIKYIEMQPTAGGMTKLIVTVYGERMQISSLVSKAQIAPDLYEIDIHKIRKQRGLTANAYYWVLIDKIAKVLGSSKQEVHTEMIRRYGTLKTDENGDRYIFPLAPEKDPKGIAPYTLRIAEKELNGKPAIFYAVLKGSSEMDNSEFNALLQGCRSEAADLDIEVMTPKEIAELEYIGNTYTDNTNDQKEPSADN